MTNFIGDTDDLPELNNFAVVAFSTNAYLKSPLTSADDAMSTVEGLRYTSGWTHTASALELCRRELDKSDAERAIVLVTDGSPTRPYTSGPKFQEAKDEATKQTKAAKDDDGITMITVLVDDSSTSSADYLKTLSSEGFFLQVNDAADLENVQESLSDLIQCA